MYTMGEGCLFCKIASGEVPAKKVYDDGKIIAFLDINPAGTLKGHTLVMPKEHRTGIEDCEADLLAAVMRAIKKIVPAVREVSGAEGINVLRNEGKAAGELVPHLHFHVIPRGGGDGIHFEENRRSAAEEELSKTAEEIKAKLKG